MKPPAFQFYARDWLSSTLGMPWDAAGVYIHLLAWSWDNGPLPKSAKWRRRILGSNANRLWIDVKSRWKCTKNGWINPRLEYQRKMQALFAFRGEKGAKARWQGDDISSQASVKHMHNRWPASASASSDQDQPAAQRPVYTPPFKIYRAIALRAFAEEPTDDLGAIAERFKTACAQQGLDYPPDITTKAINVARAVRARRRA